MLPPDTLCPDSDPCEHCTATVADPQPEMQHQHHDEEDLSQACCDAEEVGGVAEDDATVPSKGLG